MKHNFRFFIQEGAGNMVSHGFMSFAAIGITVACLLIMGTFYLEKWEIWCPFYRLNERKI